MRKQYFYYLLMLVTVLMFGLSACTSKYNQVKVNAKVEAGYPVSSANYRPIGSINSLLENAYEFVYLTKDGGRLVEASALFLVPKNAKNKLIVYAHPTSGIGQSCGMDSGVYQWTISNYIKALLNEGYQVVLPNYRGLGLSNTQHKYLNANEAAYDLLDATKASIHLFNLPADIPIVFWGYSQGGQATQRASEIADQYAQNLNIMGSIQSSAPLLLSPVWDDALAKRINLAHYIIIPLLLVGAVESNIGLSFNDFTSQKLFKYDSLKQVCGLSSSKLLLISNSKVDFTKIKPEKMQILQSYIKAQDAGKFKTAIPLLMIQGKNDDIVRQQWQKTALKRLCALDMNVYKISRDGGHMSDADIPLALKWINARFSGQKTPNSCLQR